MDNQMPEALPLALNFAILGIILLVVFVVQAVICYLVYINYKAIPPEHREMEPGMVWLNMIPCVALVWNFFVFPKLSKSYRNVFTANGVMDVGDCSEGLALAYAIVYACGIIPCVNYIAGPASLVIFIIYLVKAFEYKGRVEQLVPQV